MDGAGAYHASKERESCEDSRSEDQGNHEWRAFWVSFEYMVDFLPFSVTESICRRKGFVHVAVNYDLESRIIVSFRRTEGGDDQARIKRFPILHELDREIFLCLAGL